MLRSFGKFPTLDVLNNEDLLLGKDYFKQQTFNTGDFILKAGSICKFLYFIEEGLVYAHANDENERILWYEPTGSFFTDLESFYQQVPASAFIKVAEDNTVLLKISIENLQHLYKTSHNWAIWGIQFLQHELVRLTQYYENLRAKDATQRYEDFIKEFPDALNRMPLGHIASYLGISQVSLSRIRANVQKKK